MYCNGCRSNNIEGSRYCNYCGEKLSNEEPKKQLEESIELIGNEFNVHLLDEDYQIKNFDNELLQDDNSSTKKPWSTKKKLVAIFTPFLLCLAFLMFIINYVSHAPDRQYANAVSLMDDKEYKEAIYTLEKIKDFKDSSQLITESNYLYAKQLLAEKEYAKAKEMFVQLDSYNDSKSNIVEIDYQLGIQYLNDKEFSKAIDILNKNANYKESKQKIIEAKYNYANSLINQKDYIPAIDLLTETKGFKDTNSILNETQYKQGIILFQEGDLSNAKLYFTNIEKGYKNSQFYLDFIPQLSLLVGTWSDEYQFQQVIFSGEKVTHVFFPNANDTSVFTWNLVYENKKIKNENGDIYYLKNDKLYVKSTFDKETKVYSKISTLSNIPKEKASPYIGMSDSQVRSSNWGSPNDINRTTTKYGVNEQWVYNNGKYIYLEDGIVTAIQD